jgi:hypothetical protein
MLGWRRISLSPMMASVLAINATIRLAEYLHI